MGTFLYIPVIAVFCYIFLFMTLCAAKKNAIINAALLVLFTNILWTGGSFCMRMQIWPSVKFWYDASIFGLLLMGFALFNFAYAFTASNKKLVRILWLIITVSIEVLNIFTGVFLKCPTIVPGANGEAVFVYSIGWPVVFLFIFCGTIVAHMFVLFARYCKRDEMARRQFAPVLVGIILMFVGHIGFLFPFLSGFPTDIAAGVLFALCMFFALYKRRLFKLTLLVSRGSCYAIAAALSVVIFSNLLSPMEAFIRMHLPLLQEYVMLIVALIFTVSIFLIYFVMKRFLDSVFVRDEMVQAESLREFSLAVSKTLAVDEILGDMVDIIKKTIPVKRIYVCVGDDAGETFTIAHSTSPLDRRSFKMTRDNPVIQWLQEHNECLLMKDFRRTVAFRSMWEKEKQQLAELGVECFAPLTDEDGLVGVVLLSAKERGANAFTYDDLNFLASVNSIGSIAVKNSRLYEKAYNEARTDELTGLLNRKYFYETLQHVYDSTRDHALALIILNLDDFKLYNQLYGNREGDTALQNVAQILRACVGDNGHVARYSGKEFAVILPQYDQLSAKNLAENMREQILDMNKRSSDYALKALTCSIGVCSIPYVANNIQQLIHYADMAVYHVKHSGKNAVMAYANGETAAREAKTASNGGEKESVYSEYANTIFALTAAIDTKDHYTFSHSKSVAYYATQLALAYGLNADCLEIVKEAALLHDIGKIGIPEHILNKPGRLTEEEYTIMKGHVENSIGIIRHLPSLDYVIPAVIGHHERFDGRGYPRRISGEDIPLMARILCIADSFDAMISARSYKQPYTVEYALDVLLKEAGRQFDPHLAPLFVQLVQTGVIQANNAENAGVPTPPSAAQALVQPVSTMIDPVALAGKAI